MKARFGGRRAAVAALLAFGLIAAACGDDGGKSGTPGTTPPPAGGDEGGGQPGAGTREVEGRVLSVISPGVFTIGSLQVDARGARFSGGSASSIHQGVQVHATGTIKSGVLTATRVEIDD
jgi:hypothetical protein